MDRGGVVVVVTRRGGVRRMLGGWTGLPIVGVGVCTDTQRTVAAVRGAGAVAQRTRRTRRTRCTRRTRNSSSSSPRSRRRSGLIAATG